MTWWWCVELEDSLEDSAQEYFWQKCEISIGTGFWVQNFVVLIYYGDQGSII